ncbi:MAG: Gfo/Idh/MocA family oxidoreductase [Verrucomicrobiae bacterium]|nr:Gfo/Idh/MocA family oxidoreductase [Verrucomicrobiae bacterium]MDW8343538.1 Gfo/Idh/MocA family oxidoreductase [Verrucomicrobiae bacterium]
MGQRKWRVAVSGIGWCGCAHIKAFQKHPRCEVVRLHGRDEARVRRNLEQYGVSGCRAEIVTRVEDLFREGIDILSIAGLNSTHTPLALEAARRGIHLMIEKPVARDAEELDRLVQGVRAAGVKTVVSFELYWNPLLKVARWLMESGRLGRVMFVRANYHSRVGAWYSGWDWCRTREEGHSMLLNAGCHAVDAVRNFTNDRPLAVSAFHTTGWEQGYEYPTTIHLNIQFAQGQLGQVSASADVATPYHFGLEIYGTLMSVVNQYLRWPTDAQVSVEELQKECPVPDVRFFLEPYNERFSQIRVECILPNSVSVDHHPFLDEVFALVDAIERDDETPLSLERAAITHRICFAADRSAEQNGVPVAL